MSSPNPTVPNWELVQDSGELVQDVRNRKVSIASQLGTCTRFFLEKNQGY